MMNASIDPKLKSAISRGMAREGEVHAAFTLRASDGVPLSPEGTDSLVKEIVGKASQATQKSVGKLVVFKNLQSFSIEAPAELVESLTQEDSVWTASLGS